MTVDEALKSAPIQRADAEILLADLLGKDRAWLLAHGSDPVDDSSWSVRVTRRIRGEPVAYITGKREFCGRSFGVTRDVLIPRPATETLVDLTSDFLVSGKEEVREADTGIVVVSKTFGDVHNIETVVDIGTGSGCIAITLKRLHPRLTVIATDVSEAALIVAQKNAEINAAKIQFLQGNLLKPLADIRKPFLVVSNPPYIPTGRSLPPGVINYEPHESLFGGEQGTDVIKELVAQCRSNPYCRGIALECEKVQVIELA